MKLLKYICIIATIAVTASCDRDELLDVKPKGVELPQTVEHYRLMLDSRKGGSVSKGFIQGHLNDFILSDDVKALDGLQGSYVSGTGGLVYANALSWEDHLCDIDEEDPDWQGLYSVLYVCNVILEKLEGLDGNPDEIAQLVAEAKVHRAYSHFILVNLYAKHYNSATAETDLGVVIQTSSEFGSLVRGTVQQTYDLILADLTDALNTESLPDTPLFNLRPSKASVNAMLARVYLMMGDYGNAKLYADNCLKLNSFLYDYENMGAMPETYFNEELLLEKQYGPSYIPRTHLVNDDLLALYDVDNDLRYSTFFNDDYNFPGNKAYKRTSQLHPYVGPSIPEMYLIRAECNARDEQVSNAIADLNVLREMRYANEPDTTVDKRFVDYDVNGIGSINMERYNTMERFLSANTWQEALTLAKQERRRELAGRGARWFDLKRYNQHDNANISLTRTFDGETHTLDANSPKWVLPIARKYIQMNPELEQNPRE